MASFDFLPLLGRPRPFFFVFGDAGGGSTKAADTIIVVTECETIKKYVHTAATAGWLSAGSPAMDKHSEI